MRPQSAVGYKRPISQYAQMAVATAAGAPCRYQVSVVFAESQAGHGEPKDGEDGNETSVVVSIRQQGVQRYINLAKQRDFNSETTLMLLSNYIIYIMYSIFLGFF